MFLCLCAFYMHQKKTWNEDSILWQPVALGEACGARWRREKKGLTDCYEGHHEIPLSIHCLALLWQGDGAWRGEGGEGGHRGVTYSHSNYLQIYHRKHELHFYSLILTPQQSSHWALTHQFLHEATRNSLSTVELQGDVIQGASLKRNRLS